MRRTDKAAVTDRLRLGETFNTTTKEQPIVKFAMNKSLSKGIKENDVSKIIDVSNEVEPELAGLLDEQKDLRAVVNQLRKKYDELAIKSNKINEEIAKKTRVVEEIRAEQTALTTQINGAKQNMRLKEKQFDEFNASLQSCLYNFDILREMQARLKKDILVFKKRNFDREYGLRKERLRLSSLKHDDFDKTRLSSCCREVLQEVQKTVSVKAQQRNTRIQSVYDVLGQKYSSVKKQEQRREEIVQLVGRAMSEKLPEEKEWINICLVNVFLKRFLKNKMERLIRENSVAESAYHQIRSRTDVVDSRDFINRFIDREKDYGMLLSSIAEKENVLERLKEDNDKLGEVFHQLTLQAGEILENSAGQMKDFGPLQKQVQELQEEIKNVKNKRELMAKWVLRFHCAFFNQSRQETEFKLSSVTFEEQIRITLQEISKYVDLILQDKKAQESITACFMSTRTPSSNPFDEEMAARNKRVRTSAVEEPVNEVDNSSEAEFMLHNRRLIKKNDLARRFRIKTQAPAK